MLYHSAVILENYNEKKISKGFSSDYGKYKSQLTGCKVVHPETDFKISILWLKVELKIPTSILKWSQGPYYTRCIQVWKLYIFLASWVYCDL